MPKMLSIDARLEEALHHAGNGNDINSLKALARQEATRAQQYLDILTAVLEKTGDVVLTDLAIGENKRTLKMQFVGRDTHLSVEKQ